MEGNAVKARGDTITIARQLRTAATRLEKLTANAVEAVDSNIPKPSAIAPGQPPANEPNNINSILRATMRTLQRVEDNISEVHTRLGNPFADRPAISDGGELAG